MDTKFYHYSQNNSGGFFLKEFAHHVIIEAGNADAANARAEEIGLYFGGVSSGIDCECCGDRWSRASDRDGEPFPHVYGGKIENGKTPQYVDNYEIRFLDGTISKNSAPKRK